MHTALYSKLLYTNLACTVPVTAKSNNKNICQHFRHPPCLSLYTTLQYDCTKTHSLCVVLKHTLESPPQVALQNTQQITQIISCQHFEDKSIFTVRLRSIRTVLLSRFCVDCDKTKAPSKKVQLWLTNRKSPTSFPMSLRWTSYVAPNPQTGLKSEFFPIFRIKKIGLFSKKSLLQSFFVWKLSAVKL